MPLGCNGRMDTTRLVTSGVLPRLLLGLLTLSFGSFGRDASAQSRATPAPTQEQTPRVAGARLAAGSDVTVTATRIAKPIEMDGRLDDDVYQSVKAITGFLQQEPDEGDLTSERTDVWVLFDDKNIYVSAKCWDSHPEREVITELRRDNGNIFQDETFTVVFDTFHDLRNGFMFQTNPIAAQRDQAIVDDTNNQSWSTVWDVRTARH